MGLFSCISNNDVIRIKDASSGVFVDGSIKQMVATRPVLRAVVQCLQLKVSCRRFLVCRVVLEEQPLPAWILLLKDRTRVFHSASDSLTLLTTISLPGDARVATHVHVGRAMLVTPLFILLTINRCHLK
jgi:hypothetical protein